MESFWVLHRVDWVHGVRRVCWVRWEQEARKVSALYMELIG
jgi:hypothetical protein